MDFFKDLEKMGENMTQKAQSKTLQFQYDTVNFALKKTLPDGTEFSVNGRNPENVIKGYNIFKQMVEKEIE